MEYTKGKWEADIRVGVATVHVKDDEEYNCLDSMRSQCIYYATGEQVLNEDGSFKEWTISPEAVANAHLIAAAPAMYEALLAALGVYYAIQDEHPWVTEIIDVTEQALAQADKK